MAGTWLMVTWAGGGNVNPFLGLAGHLLARGHRVGALATASLRPRLAAAGIEVVAAADGWLPDADEVCQAVQGFAPDALIVDYMLTGALCGAERCRLPTVALVHTLYTALLVEGAPHPIGMAGSIEAINDVRVRAGQAPIARHADLLAVADMVLVTAPRELDAPGELPSNVVYAGALFEGPGDDAGWRPPGGDGPLVAVSVGTAGDPAAETELLGRILDALAQLPVRGFVMLADYIDRHVLRPPDNVTLAGYVRHAAVLPHAGLLVTHAGLGSVVAALACGVPMVCLPLTREQPENAEAVVRLRAGRALRPDASVGEIAAAISEQLDHGGRVQIVPDHGPALDQMDCLLERGHP
jgi:UDP:flavonoid glycosyltransferase YjiC (YdhE family)